MRIAVVRHGEGGGDRVLRDVPHPGESHLPQHGYRLRGPPPVRARIRPLQAELPHQRAGRCAGRGGGVGFYECVGRMIGSPGLRSSVSKIGGIGVQRWIYDWVG